MRTRNPNYRRAADTVLGRTSPRRAGSRGITFRDATTEAHPVVDLLVQGGTITDNDDGTAVLTIDGSGVTVPGAVSGDGSPFSVSAGADHRAFPGVAWLTNPTDAIHAVGDKFLIVYRHGTTHLIGGKIVGKIGTVTSVLPWTYTLGSQFDIEDVANDLRGEDFVSVLDIGGGDYRAVVAAREYNGTVNLSPHVLICDTAAASMTTASTWTRYNITGGLTGHTQDYTQGRVQKLSNGNYLLAGGYISGGVSTAVSLTVAAITNWSAPTMTTIATTYTETDIEVMPSGTLFAHLRNAANTFHFTSTSTNSGGAWSAATSLYAATGYPMFRRLTSGVGVAVNRSVANSSDTYYRQTQSAITDTGWGSEVALDTTASYHSSYATILQLDNTHALVIWATEADGADPVDSDIFSSVFTDTSVVGSASAGQLYVSSGDTTVGYLDDKLLAGSGISLTKGSAGANETLTIAASAVPATSVTVADAGGYYVAATVEAVLAELGAKRYAGEILVSDTPAGSPIVFTDLLQNEAQTDLLYADP